MLWCWLSSLIKLDQFIWFDIGFLLSFFSFCTCLGLDGGFVGQTITTICNWKKTTWTKNFQQKWYFLLLKFSSKCIFVCAEKNEGASLRILDLTAGCTWIYIAYFWCCFSCLGINDDSLLFFCYQSWFVKTSLGAPERKFSRQALSSRLLYSYLSNKRAGLAEFFVYYMKNYGYGDFFHLLHEKQWVRKIFFLSWKQ